MRRYPRVFVFIFICISLLLGSAFSAGAHAFITLSNPKSGEVLDRFPENIMLTFNEDVNVSSKSFTLLDPTGQKIDIISKKYNNKITIKTKFRDFAVGSYLLTYSIVSKDGHLISGVLPFSYKSSSITTFTTNTLNNKVVKFNEVVLWFLIIFLASLTILKRGKRERLVLLITGLLLIGFNIIFLIEKIGFQIYLYNPGRYLLAILLALIASFIAHNKLMFYVTSFLFGSMALFSGHTLDLPGLQSYAKFLVLTHLVAIYLWISAVFRLKLEPTVKQLRVSRFESTIAIFTLLISGSGALYFILINSDINFTFLWVKLISIKIIIFLLIALLGLYHHKLSKDESLILNSNFKKSVTIELLFFIIIMGLSGGLTANPAPITNHNLSLATTKVASLIKFNNGLIADYTIEGEGDTKMLMLNFRKPLNESITKIEIYASNPKYGIKDIKGELVGGGDHFMGEILLPYKGEWSLLLDFYEDEFTIVSGKESVKI